MDLAAFLLARIAEDEALARAAHDTRARWWRYKRSQTHGVWASAEEGGPGRRVAYAATSADQDHITHWDPTRVLVECKAKRRMVTLHHPAPSDDAAAGRCQHDGQRHPCPTLRLLALVYGDHFDYRQEWRP
jgi:hypothetical protein